LTRVRSLVQRAKADYAMPPAGLSKREVEAARLVALGNSDADTRHATMELRQVLALTRQVGHKRYDSGPRVNERGRARSWDAMRAREAVSAADFAWGDCIPLRQVALSEYLGGECL